MNIKNTEYFESDYDGDDETATNIEQTLNIIIMALCIY